MSSWVFLEGALWCGLARRASVPVPVVEQTVQSSHLVADCRDLASIGQLENLALLQVGSTAVAILPGHLAVPENVQGRTVLQSQHLLRGLRQGVAREKPARSTPAAANATAKVNRVAFMIEPFVMQ
jgi:hypothetical protein